MCLGTVLSIRHTHLILTTDLRSRYYYIHFTNTETRAQKVLSNLPKGIQWHIQEPDSLESGCLITMWHYTHICCNYFEESDYILLK